MKYMVLALLALGFSPSVFADDVGLAGKPARRLMVAMQRAGAQTVCEGKCVVEISNVGCSSSVETPEAVTCEFDSLTKTGDLGSISAEGPHALNLQTVLSEAGGGLICDLENCSLAAAAARCESFAGRQFHCTASF